MRCVRSRRGAVVAGLSALLALLPPVAAGCQAPTPDTPPPARVAASASGASAKGSQLRLLAARALLEARLPAAETGDVDRWLARLEGGNLLAEQRQVLAGMHSIGVRDLALRTLDEVEDPAPTAAGRTVTWHARARFDYRIAGFDDSARSFALDLTFRTDDDAADGSTALVASSPSERPQPWDLPSLTVTRSTDAIILAFRGGPPAAEVAARVTAAVRQVSDVLGSAGPAVWIAPATDADAARLLGRDEAELDGLGAVVDGPIGPGRPAGSDRIILIPSAWTGLTATGRDVVMAHELTHATTRRVSLRQPPLWLSEGLAEFVAYHGLTLPERTAVAPALAHVRSEGIPTALPDAAAFDPASASLEVSYGLSLVAARTIAEEYGVAALVALFRAAAGVGGSDGLPDADAAVDRFLVARLGTDRAAVTAAWQRRLAHLLE